MIPDSARMLSVPLSRWSSVARMILQKWWIPAGLLVFLTVPFWAPTRNSMKTMVYLSCLLPAFILLIDVKSLYRYIRSNLDFALLTAILAYLAVSSIWQDEPDRYNYFKFMTYIFLFIYGLAVHLKVSEEAITKLLLLGVAGCSIGALVTLMMVVQGQPGVVTAGGRIVGYTPLKNPLLTGNLLGVYCTLLLGWFITDKNQARHWPIALVLGVPIFIVMLGTGSRSSLLAFLVAFGVIVMRVGSRRSVYFLICMVGLALVASALFWELLSSRGLSYRLELWSKAIELCMQRPWLGYGAGTDIVLRVQDGTMFNDTHNIPLAVWYYAGLPALLMWLWLYAVLGFKLFRASSDLTLIVLGLLVYGFTTSFFEGGGLLKRPVEFWYQVWLPIALAFTSLNLCQDKRPVA